MSKRRPRLTPLADRGPLRVMFVISSMPVGGAETLLVNLVRRLDRERFAPELCCLQTLGPLGELLSNEIPTFAGLIGGKYDVGVAFRLAQLFRTRRIDAVVTVGAGDKMFWGRIAARIAGVPVVCSAIHSTGWPDVIERPNRWRLLTRWTDAFIGVARPHGEHLIRQEGFPAAKVRVIPNGVDAKLFRPRLGERPGGPVRVLGMWRPQTEVRRGIKLLRETFDALRVRFGDEVSLELFGWDVPQGPSKAPSYARHHGVLTPRGVGDLMRSVDIVVEPSLYQGFGLSGLEAMASGAVLVSTACRGVDEYATHDENALVVPHADLAAAVGRAIEDRDLRARLRQAGIETAPRFAWPVIGARWALYLADLAERRGARALVAGMERVVGRAREALDKKDHG